MMVRLFGLMIFFFFLVIFTADDWLKNDTLRQTIIEKTLKAAAPYGLKNFEIALLKKNRVILSDIEIETPFTPIRINQVEISFKPDEVLLFALLTQFDKQAPIPTFNLSSFEIELKEKRKVMAYPHRVKNELVLQPENLKLSEILAFFDVNTALIDGDAHGRFILRPFSKGPYIDGIATLSNAFFQIEAIGLNLEGIEAKLRLTENGLELLTAKDKKNYVQAAKGKFLFSSQKKLPYDLELEFKEALILNHEPIKATGSGLMRFQGTLDSAALSGKVEASKLSYSLQENDPKELAPLNVRFIHKEKIEPYLVLFDLEIKVPPIATATSQELSSLWAGELHLLGSHKAPLLKGEMRLQSGEYNFNGRRVPLTEGKLFFDGDWIKKTSLYVIAEMDLKKIVAEIIVKGPVINPELTLRSNPPLSEKEILSWILFNKGLDTISAFQGNELGRSLQIMKHMKSGKNPLNEIRQTLGIDRIDLDRRETLAGSDVSLQVGKYLTKGLYVGLSRSINSNTNRFGLEAELLKNVKLQAEIGDDSQGQLHLKWKKDY